jgi:phosphatidylcholine synthase
MRQLGGYLVDAFTSIGALCGLFSLYAIYVGQFQWVWYLTLVAIFIDSFDGTLARWVKKGQTRIDGALLDNIIDYLTYVIVPAFYLLAKTGILEGWMAFVAAGAIVLSSAYQFSQVDAKTEDHYFKGFPDYWNILVFYLAIFAFPARWNFWIIALGVILVFVPIKYIYPSRIEFVFKSEAMRWIFRIATGFFGLAFVGLVLGWPNNMLWLIISGGYIFMYVLLSLYRTIRPIV